MIHIQTGLKVVWGVPSERKPVDLTGFEGAKVKLRLRNRKPGRIFIRERDMVSEFILENCDTVWKPKILVGVNSRLTTGH